jgi:hypothetical protein
MNATTQDSEANEDDCIYYDNRKWVKCNGDNDYYCDWSMNIIKTSYGKVSVKKTYSDPLNGEKYIRESHSYKDKDGRRHQRTIRRYVSQLCKCKYGLQEPHIRFITRGNTENPWFW